MENPWSWLLSNVKRRMNTDWDNMIGVQGERGSGKSTLALRIALAISPEFAPSNVFYDAKDWQIVARGPKKQTFILDEGTNIAFNRTWQNRGQVQLMQLLNVIRQRNHTLIWCAPNLERMDVVVRGDIVKYRLSTLRRGEALLHERKYDWEKESVSWQRRGRITWRSLEWHPIWRPYEAGKASNYSKTVAKPVQKPSGVAVNPELRNQNRDPITHKFIPKATAEV